MPVSTSTIDVFFCSLPSADAERREMAVKCFDEWSKGLARLWWITPGTTGSTDMSFQSERRVYADRTAPGEFYILTDDDCLPPSGNWMEQAFDILERHPEFAILSLWPSNANINRWTPENYITFEDREVMEHFSVGNIRVCRKGILKEWPQQIGKAYDTEHCEAIRQAGFRVGYFHNLKMVHLGEGKTTLR